MSPREQMYFDGNRLKIGNGLSGYSIEPDQHYPQMWRVRRPDGSLSDMVNKSRAGDAAMAMLDRELRKLDADRGRHRATAPLGVPGRVEQAGDV
jgi:hypothetical protein